MVQFLNNGYIRDWTKLQILNKDGHIVCSYDSINDIFYVDENDLLYQIHICHGHVNRFENNTTITINIYSKFNEPITKQFYTDKHIGNFMSSWFITVDNQITRDAINFINLNSINNSKLFHYYAVYEKYILIDYSTHFDIYNTDLKLVTKIVCPNYDYVVNAFNDLLIVIFQNKIWFYDLASNDIHLNAICEPIDLIKQGPCNCNTITYDYETNDVVVYFPSDGTPQKIIWPNPFINKLILPSIII